LKHILTESQLEDALSWPSAADVQAMRSLDGDILILGAGGKMGPSLARLARRACDAAGVMRRVIAVSRFTNPALRQSLEQLAIETLDCDLLDPARVNALPDCENVLFLAGRKFGSAGRPDITWAMNTVVPSLVARRFSSSRIVVFSTGNLYPLVPPDSGGASEETELQPAGEYAQSCLGRERIFEYYSQTMGTRALFYRLNYATDLRYGVLVDIAGKVHDGIPISVAMGWFNTLWQGDANSYALRSLALCQSPPLVLNVTGPDTLSVREVAEYFGGRFWRGAILEGSESGTALLSNATKCHKLLGPVSTDAYLLMEWVASWIEAGGSSMNKPTHFEVRDGKF
jgi:hypothetical protein